jgi:hypothetical protein
MAAECGSILNSQRTDKMHAARPKSFHQV